MNENFSGYKGLELLKNPENPAAGYPKQPKVVLKKFKCTLAMLINCYAFVCNYDWHLHHKRLGTSQISMLKFKLFLPQNRLGIMRKKWGKSFREEGTSSELRTSALLLIFCLH